MRFLNQPGFASAIVAALLAMPALCGAVPVAYTTQAAFLGAVAAPATDNFDSLPSTDGPIGFASVTRSAGAYGYTVATNTPSLWSIGPGGADRWLTVEDLHGTLTFSNFSGGVHGIGGFFFVTDSNGSPVAQTVTAVASDGTSITASLSSTTPGSFLGFVSDDPIVSLILGSSSTNNEDFVTVDDLILAGRQQPVPEPGSLALVAFGFAALGMARRRGAREVAHAGAAPAPRPA